MRILVLEKEPQQRDALLKRVQSSFVQAGLKRAELLSGGLSTLGANAAKGAPEITFLGPSYYQDLEDSIARVRSVYPETALAVVLDNDIYAAEAVELRRSISVRIMPLADVAQMAQFILDASSARAKQNDSAAKGVIAVTHLKGGVGGSTIANGLAACWAMHGKSVALLDLDDLNPQLTDWARVPRATRDAVARCLTQGEIPKGHLGQLVHTIEDIAFPCSIVGQPQYYGESFHMKADVITGAPSSADFIDALIPQLQSVFDVVLIDTGNSWGISTFASLPYCEHVVLACDEDSNSVRRSLDILSRLYAESDDPAEFDLSKWSLVLNSYTSHNLSLEDAAGLVADKELFPDSLSLHTLPPSAMGSSWVYSKESFFELSEPSVQQRLIELAFSLIPFRYQLTPEQGEDIVGRLRKSIKTLVGA